MAKETKKAAKDGASEEEQIGFHKGALSTLVKERQEMLRILQIVEQLMQMHISSLKELGVDLAKEAESIQKDGKKAPKKPIEDLIN
jgi:hypothetical protein